MKKITNSGILIREQNIILGLSLPLVALLLACSAVGLLDRGIYQSSTLNWMTQTVVQDGVNLFLIAPVLVVAALYSFQGVKFAYLMWGGTVSYLVYTFLIYCFSVPFNILFLPYCLVLGLSSFSLFWFVTTQARTPVVTKLESKFILRASGIYFIIISVLFYVLWLREIIPAALSNEIPDTLTESGLLTNPVQAIDLSIFLPVVFVAGVMAIKAKPLAAILIPVILIFFILMDVTIAALTIVLRQNGLGGSLLIPLAMGILAFFSFTLLIAFVRSTRDELSS